MTHNNDNHPEDDDLNLSPELKGVEDTQTLDAIRLNDQAEETEITDALFSDEEALEKAMDIPTLGTPKAAEQVVEESYEDALFSDEEELDKALDATASRPAVKLPEPEDETFEDALFSSADELEKALDETDARPAVKEEPEEEETFEEALFSSDDELEQALDAADAQQAEAAKGGEDAIKQELEDAQQAAEALKPKEDEQVEIDPLAFIPLSSQEDNDRPGKIYNQFSRMRLARPGLYDTPALEREDCEVGVTLEAEIREELQAIADQEAAEKAAAEPVEEVPVEEKATDKFKKLWKKNRDKLDDYLGRTLPEREITLGFIFPPLRSAKDNDIDASTFAVKAIFTKKGTSSATILKRSDAFLAGLVRTQTSDDNRTKIADLFYEQLPEHINQLLQQYYKNPSAPDTQSRALQAENARSALKNLIVTFKYLYAQLYQGSNLIYQNKREQANQLAFRIIELICFEQLLLAATRVRPDAALTGSMNRLYQALAAYEPEFLEQICDAGFLNERVSAADLYLRFQALLSIDLSSFSGAQQDIAHRYLAHQVCHLQILSERQLSACDEMLHWLVPDEHNGMPLLVDSVTPSQPQPLVILAEFMFMEIKRDYAACVDQLGSAEPDVGISVLSELNIRSKTALLAIFNHRLQELETRHRVPHYTIHDEVEWQLYSGVDDLIYYFESQLPDASLDEMPEDEVKRRLLAKRRSAKAKCAVANETEERINMQLLEVEGAPDIDIGKLLLILRKNSETGVQEQQICLVESLQRYQPGKLDIQLLKLAGQGINAMLDVEGKRHAALLLKSDSQHMLVCGTAHDFWNGKKQPTVLPDGETYQLNIDALKVLNHEMQILTLL